MASNINISLHVESYLAVAIDGIPADGKGCVRIEQCINKNPFGGCLPDGEEVQAANGFDDEDIAKGTSVAVAVVYSKAAGRWRKIDGPSILMIEAD